MGSGRGRERASRDTSQRRAIRDAVEGAGRPLSAAEILDAARAAVPRLGMATVYRAVRRMRDEGAVHQVDLPGGAPRYESSGKDHHHHFHCRACQRVYEVEACPGERALPAPPGFSLEAHEVILYGRCPSCLPPAPRKRGGRRTGPARARGRLR
ncbi:MAG: ferric uptake regulator family protein [Acidobacteria bacterium]|jgi:Fur family ferric uptake transcriptional regulator|nr:ferric uptake regulator family protein [Acidobacteriota bacterium]